MTVTVARLLTPVVYTALFVRKLRAEQLGIMPLNDLVARGFASAGIPVTKEPSGLFRSDGKRPDGLSLIPWLNGKSLCWDVTVIYPLAESYVNEAAREAGTAAEIAASRKEAKHADIDSRFVFEPIAVETLGVLNSSARLLLSDLGRRITNISGEARELSFLYQRISVLVQRVSTPYCCMTVCRPLIAQIERSTYFHFVFPIFKLLREHRYRGLNNNNNNNNNPEASATAACCERTGERAKSHNKGD